MAASSAAPSIPYKLLQLASRTRLRCARTHPNVKPGDKIEFAISGDKYIVGPNGQYWRENPKSKGSHRQAKKLRRDVRVAQAAFIKACNEEVANNQARAL